MEKKEEMKDLSEIMQKVNEVDDGVTKLIVPILKDTIKDSNKHNTRLFILNVLLILSMLVVSIVAIMVVMKQNENYAKFLSQFEIESDIVQDFDTGENGDIYNPVINNTK